MYADLAVAAGSLVLNLVQVPIALVFLTRDNNPTDGKKQSSWSVIWDAIVKACRQPVVWAPVFAFVLLLAGLEIPKNIKGSFTLLGQATGGVALFAVGAILYSQKVSVSLPVVINVILKNIVLPAVVLVSMIMLAIPTAERGLVGVTLAIPSASIAVIFSVQFHVGEKEMASTLFWSTILSVITMGGFIWATAS